MKSQIQNLTMLSAVIAFASCNSGKTETSVNKNDVVTEKPVSDTVSVAETPTETRSIEGTVKEMEFGKDGFTATILTSDNVIYKATSSHANLRNPKQYRTFNVNEVVKLSGDFWKMGDENRITVREIQ